MLSSSRFKIHEPLVTGAPTVTGPVLDWRVTLLGAVTAPPIETPVEPIAWKNELLFIAAVSSTLRGLTPTDRDQFLFDTLLATWADRPRAAQAFSRPIRPSTAFAGGRGAVAVTSLAGMNTAAAGDCRSNATIN
jgi:hypothetical protein